MITFADRFRGRGLIRRKGTGHRKERTQNGTGRKKGTGQRGDGTTGGAADKKDVISFCAALFF